MTYYKDYKKDLDAALEIEAVIDELPNESIVKATCAGLMTMIKSNIETGLKYRMFYDVEDVDSVSKLQYKAEYYKTQVIELRQELEDEKRGSDAAYHLNEWLIEKLAEKRKASA